MVFKKLKPPVKKIFKDYLLGKEKNRSEVKTKNSHIVVEGCSIEENGKNSFVIQDQPGHSRNSVYLILLLSALFLFIVTLTLPPTQYTTIIFVDISSANLNKTITDSTAQLDFENNVHIAKIPAAVPWTNPAEISGTAVAVIFVIVTVIYLIDHFDYY